MALVKDPNPKKTKKLAKISLILTAATAFIISVWDTIPAMWPGRNDTISENIRNLSRTWWIIPLFWGTLTSHFFINIGQPSDYKLRFYILLGILILLLAANTFTVLRGIGVPVWARVGCLVIGMILGLLLWSQDK